MTQEHLILTALNFDLTFPTSFTFLERFVQLANLDKDHEAELFSMYLCELTLVDLKMLKYKPSLLAMASVFLAKKILKRPSPWCQTLQEHSSYKERQVRECAREICILLNNVPKKKQIESLYKKYSFSRYGRVSLIPERLQSQAVYQQSRNEASSRTVTESATSSVHTPQTGAD